MSEEKQTKPSRDAQQFGKTLLGIEAARIEIMRAADPVAADRAKRYIWSRIERNQANSGRVE
jgi:hypothetical protein